MKSLFQRIQKLIIDAFGFSKTETNGILILILLVVLTALLPRIYLAQSPPAPEEDILAFNKWSTEIEKSIRIKKSASNPSIELQKFNPNTDGYNKLIRSGIPITQANRLIAYRNKGGTFRKKEDLKKIYGLSDSVFTVLEPFIEISLDQRPVIGEPEAENPAVKEFIPVIFFDLNRASAEELQKIRGVGPVLSTRIVKYRDLLGGFHDYPQLNEVYGLKPEVIDEIVKHSMLKEQLETVKLNESDSISQLAKHPYIDYNLARAILNYRKVHGNFADMSQLRNIKILDDSLYHKLAPYLSL